MFLCLFFFNESTLCMRWPKYWSFSFSFSISPSNEYAGLISFRMDCLDLHAVQGTLKSLLQHHSSKASILWRSAFFIHVATLEESGVCCFPSSRGLTTWVSLEWDPEIRVAPVSLAPHERLPEILVVPREKTPTGAAARGNP